MKYILGIFAFIFLNVAPASAYELVVTEANQPYEVVTIESDKGPEHVYLGELDNFPVIYEIKVDESTDFNVQIRQLYKGVGTPLLYSLILIRENELDGGVTEIARLTPDVQDWTMVKDSVLGITFWESEVLTSIVDSGVYRIEISSPENTGRYMLTINNNTEKLGYFATLTNVRTTQAFFGYSIFKMLVSSYLYYAFGILFLLFVIYRTWKYRQAITNVS